MVWKIRGGLLVLLAFVLVTGGACSDEDEAGVEAEVTPVTYPEGVDEEEIPEVVEGELTVDLVVTDGEFYTEEEFYVPAGGQVTLTVENDDDEEYQVVVGDDIGLEHILPDTITRIVFEAPDEVGATFEAQLFPVTEDEAVNPIEEDQVLDSVIFIVVEDLEVEEEDGDVEDDEEEGD